MSSKLGLPKDKQRPNFTCCKKKEHSYYVCVNCHAIYHRSCLERKLFITVNSYMIQCCDIKTTTINVDELVNLKTKGKQMENEIEILKNHNDKLNNIIKLNQNEGIEMEEILIDKINQIKNELKDMNNQNMSLIKDIKTYKLRLQELENQPLITSEKSSKTTQTITICLDKGVQANYEKSTEATQTTTGTREKANQVDFDTKQIPMISTRPHVKAVNNKSENMPKNCIINTQKSETIRQKKKLLILADHHGKRLLNKLQTEAPDYLIMIECKPNANLAQITYNLPDKICGFTKNDYILILAGSRDIEQNTKNSYFTKQISHILEATKHTNLIITTIPELYDTEQNHELRDSLNHQIYKLCYPHKHVNTLPFFSRFNREDFNYSGRFLTYDGNIKLAKYICNAINLNNKTNFKLIESIPVRTTNNIVKPTTNTHRGINNLLPIQINTPTDKTSLKTALLKICHINIQSLRNKTQDLEVELSLERKADVLAITEHHLNPNEESSIHLEDYQLASCFTRTNKKKGGSCIFIKEGIESEEIQHIKNESVETVIECSAIKLKNLNTIILCIYRPPNGDLQIFFQKLSAILDLLKHKDKKNKLCICGDFNIDLNNKNKKSKEFKDILTSYNLKPTIINNTRITKTSATLIDNIIINDFHYLNAQVIETGLSDHTLQQIEFLINQPIEVQNFQRSRKYNDKNLKEAYDSLQNQDWHEIVNTNDPNIGYNAFHQIMQNNLNFYFPKTNNKKKKCSSKPWVTTGIKISSKNKKELYKKLQEGLIDIEHYNKYKNIYKQVIKAAKQLQNNKFLENSNNKAKAAWQLTRKLTKKPKKSFNIENLRLGKQTDKEVLNRINKHLINICPDNPQKTTDLPELQHFEHSMFFTPITQEDIINTIRNLKNTHSTGFDEIPVKLLKHTANLIALPLEHLINLTIQTGTFPEMLKRTIIKPIFKKGDKHVITNYRPIALLSNVSKIYEKIIASQLLSYLHTFNILHKNQHGFVTGKNTETALIQVVAKIIEELNSKNKTAGIHLDLSKAFDSIDYEILYSKLEKYGIRGQAVELFKSYLTARYQKVTTEDIRGRSIASEWSIIKKGVPQGSILGPYLFIIYMNDLPPFTNLPTTLYADDTTMIAHNNTTGELEHTIECNIKAITNWFSRNNMNLNADKTTVINYRLTTVEMPPLNIQLDNATLTSEVSTKFLGIHLDQNLNWKNHIDNLAPKISSFSYVLRTLRNTINLENSLSAYYAYVHSNLSYGILLWGNATDINRIFVLQKKCLRSIFNLNHIQSVKSYFIQYRIPTLIEIYIKACAIYVHKNYEDVHEAREHNYNTRLPQHYLRAPATSTTSIQRQFTTQAVKIYNKLPENWKSLPLKKFKQNTKQFLCRGIYTINEFLDGSADFD